MLFCFQISFKHFHRHHDCKQCLLPREASSWSDPPWLPSSVQQGGFKQRSGQKNGESRQVFWQPLMNLVVSQLIFGETQSPIMFNNWVVPSSLARPSVRHVSVASPFISTICHSWPLPIDYAIPYILKKKLSPEACASACADWDKCARWYFLSQFSILINFPTSFTFSHNNCRLKEPAELITLINSTAGWCPKGIKSSSY